MSLQSMLDQAGFTAIGGRMVPAPLCEWSRGMSSPARLRETTKRLISYLGVDPKEQEMGHLFRDCVTSQTIFTLGMYPFTQKLGMSLEATQDLCARAAAEALTPSYKCYIPM
jgi:hypothetical protein